jgi:hypothetical protein
MVAFLILTRNRLLKHRFAAERRSLERLLQLQDGCVNADGIVTATRARFSSCPHFDLEPDKQIFRAGG